MPHSKRSKHLLIAEFSILARLSLPLILAQLAQSSMGFVDTVMAGRYGATDLAAVGVGSSVWFTVFLLILGILTALVPSISQARGRRDNTQIRALVPQGIYLGALLGLGAALTLRHGEHFLRLLEVDGAIIPLATNYLKAVSWGFPAIGVCFALRYCCEGLSVTRPGMLVSFGGLLVNIVANYVLVFGKLGLPALGGIGCGYATTMTMWMMLGGMVLVFRRERQLRTQRLLALKVSPHLKTLTSLLRIGLPIGIGMFVECSIFAIIALLLSRFGAQTVAAHQIAISFTGMVFMIPLSISSAISIRVAYNHGRSQRQHTRRSIGVGLATTGVLAILSSSLMATCSMWLTALFTPDADLAAAAASLLLLAAVFQVPDAIQVSAAGALRGFKDTRTPMLLQTISYWCLGLPCGCYLGLHLGMQARGFWIGLICGLSCAALLLGLRLYKVTRLKCPALQLKHGSPS